MLWQETYEKPQGQAEEPLFPHLYGPIDLASVTAKLQVTRFAQSAYSNTSMLRKRVSPVTAVLIVSRLLTMCGYGMALHYREDGTGNFLSIEGLL